MLAAIEAAMDDNPGVLSVTVDGTTVRYESSEAMARAHALWQGKVNRERGTRPPLARMKVGFN